MAVETTFYVLLMFTICPCAFANIYQYNAIAIDGDLVHFDKYKGKILLVVNVASQCGWTDNHYRGLVELQRQLGPSQLFSVLAFPCNQFGRQEPWTNQEIKRWTQENYGVNFPMFSKVNVIDQGVAPIWQFLKESSNVTPNWNFYKYLISHKGQVLKAWSPHTDVESIASEVQMALADAMKAAHSDPSRGGTDDGLDDPMVAEMVAEAPSHKYRKQDL